mgnify:CR=1 FL=1|tara:strand:- start:720 stop:1079 length:360 start_codon:yes stop_codon:yes gene_type:complete
MSILSWASISQITAIIIAIWSGWELKKSRLSVFSELKGGAHLISTGLYHMIRHPMYSALLLFFLPTVVLGEGPIVILFFFVLLTTLILKMRYEEKILKDHFAEYERYSKNTFYLIPFVY